MKKIMVVDDDVDIGFMVKLTLELNGFNVTAVSNWKETNNTIAAFQPDLIIMDVSLGDADGRELCKQIKTIEETAHIPVLLFSANAEMGKSLEDCNAQAFIAKPFELAEMVETINFYLRLN